MKKNTYMIATVKENGKYYSYVIVHHNGVNVLAEVKRIKNIFNLTICDTLREARELVEKWTKVYKENGEYMFDETF